MRSTFKVLFYMKKGSEKPNGMCRITIDVELKQFSCRMDVPPHLYIKPPEPGKGKGFRK